jgi:hypothetical protein
MLVKRTEVTLVNLDDFLDFNESKEILQKKVFSCDFPEITKIFPGPVLFYSERNIANFGVINSFLEVYVEDVERSAIGEKIRWRQEQFEIEE